jgi:hypothetical protein
MFSGCSDNIDIINPVILGLRPFKAGDILLPI